jgi:putative membrane protein
MKRLIVFLLVLYILLTVYSVVSILAGVMPPRYITPLTTLAGFAFALLHAGQRLGWKRALLLLAVVFVVSLTFESVGVATGWVYGPYHYTDKLGPLFLGLVPYLIPVAWFMMMYCSFVIADALTPSGWKRWQRTLTIGLAGGVAMTAWDVVMDPMMVAGGHWVWEAAGAYFGIPLQNFFGWWLTTFAALTVYLAFGRGVKASQAPALDRLAVVSYLATGMGAVVISMAYNPAVGLTGLMALTPWVIAGWLRM